MSEESEERKELGKILDVKFGIVPNYPFLFGTIFSFKLAGGAVTECRCKYTFNFNEVSENTEFTLEEQKNYMYTLLKQLHVWLQEAKVTNIEQLKNVPVEVTLNGNVFESFRILTEVL